MPDRLRTDVAVNRVNEHACPYCGRVNDSASYAATITGGGVKAGDLSVCWACRRIGRYHVNALGVVSVRAIPKDEERRLARSPEMRELLASLDRARTPLEGAADARRRVGRG